MIKDLIISEKTLIGVIGIIFELVPTSVSMPRRSVSRAAMSVICVASRETIRTNRVLVELMRQALSDSGLNEDCIAWCRIPAMQPQMTS